ncbi:MAG: alanine racemase [Acidimicrobiaceae bacterium]|nr:alanine racemase [Acidimicrobiaceae bacterium]
MPAEGVHRPAWAEVSTSALSHNLGVLRRVVPGARVCGVVKANGYGHGEVLVARALQEAGVDHLAVAILDEGLELRQAGVHLPILLLAEIPADTLDAALDAGLTVTVGSLAGARALVDTAERRSEPVTCHLKVDTGMLRQGVGLDEALEAARLLSASSAVDLEGLFTHFSVADGETAEHREFTRRQRERFARVRRDLASVGIAPRIVHDSNSAGALGYDSGSTTMIRPGLALYGYLPAPWLGESLEQRGETLEPVMTLRAHVVARRRAEAGERPSYGRWRALERSANLVTVPFGYADGYPRRLFHAGSEVLIGGRRYPLAGMVTMDQLIVNCGDDDVAVGDEVVLLGRMGDELISADDWARWADTVTWEILCGVSARVPRVLVP